MALPKIIAFYLPQYHQIPENDAWWGKGFTEWTAVKKGKQLFTGHRQPRIPWGKKYYDLMDPNILPWQAALAKDYGIYGFAFYHYWFETGRRILEKPAEMLLSQKNIDIPYCFHWANQTWARTWSNLGNINSWADTCETAVEKGTTFDGVLIKQRYGDKADWLDHINYLIPFFLDPRYITFCQQPVLIIYQPQDIYCLPDMLSVWNRELQKHDIPNLYIIGEVVEPSNTLIEGLDAGLIRFPDYAMRHMPPTRLKNGLALYDYDSYWDILLRNTWNTHGNSKLYLSAAVDYDSTPRRGVNGWMLQGTSVKSFHTHFRDFMKMNVQLKNDFVFINAWNEWGEGMYLEPDAENGYGFLNAIKGTVQELNQQPKILLEKNTETTSCDVHQEKPDSLLKPIYQKYTIQMLSNWLDLRRKGTPLLSYFHKNNYRKIAIYGYGYLGKQLTKELEDSDVIIAYIIDRNSSINAGKYSVYPLSNNLPEVDSIIVTPAGQYGAIRNELHKYMPDTVTVSIEHIISELL